MKTKVVKRCWERHSIDTAPKNGYRSLLVGSESRVTTRQEVWAGEKTVTQDFGFNIFIQKGSSLKIKVEGMVSLHLKELLKRLGYERLS